MADMTLTEAADYLLRHAPDWTGGHAEPAISRLVDHARTAAPTVPNIVDHVAPENWHDERFREGWGAAVDACLDPAPPVASPGGGELADVDDQLDLRSAVTTLLALVIESERIDTAGAGRHDDTEHIWHLLRGRAEYKRHVANTLHRVLRLPDAPATPVAPPASGHDPETCPLCGPHPALRERVGEDVIGPHDAATRESATDRGELAEALREAASDLDRLADNAYADDDYSVAGTLLEAASTVRRARRALAAPATRESRLASEDAGPIEPDSREAIDHPCSECVPCGPGCAGHWTVPDHCLRAPRSAPAVETERADEPIACPTHGFFVQETTSNGVTVTSCAMKGCTWTVVHGGPALSSTVSAPGDESASGDVLTAARVETTEAETAGLVPWLDGQIADAERHVDAMAREHHNLADRMEDRGITLRQVRDRLASPAAREESGR